MVYPTPMELNDAQDAPVGVYIEPVGNLRRPDFCVPLSVTTALGTTLAIRRVPPVSR